MILNFKNSFLTEIDHGTRGYSYLIQVKSKTD